MIRIINVGAAVSCLSVALLMATQESYGFAAILLFIGLLNAMIAFRRG